MAASVNEVLCPQQQGETEGNAPLSSLEANDGSQKLERGRKRNRQQLNWRQNIRKRLRNSGKSYVGRTGKTVQAKVFIDINCNCRRKCKDFVPSNVRKSLFEAFWKMGNFSTQNAYISGMVKSVNVARRRPRSTDNRKKESTYQYYLPLPKSLRVCKKIFLQTFVISDGRLTRTLQAAKNPNNSPGADKRGTGISHNKSDVGRTEHAKKHIASFPAYCSHYSRQKNPNRKYLNPDLNIRKMYVLYKELCASDNKIPLSEAVYRNIFKRDFNLQFHMPTKDSCKTCDAFNQQIAADETVSDERKADLQREHELHLRKAESVRNNLAKDKNNADDNTRVYTFDLQKALSFPRLSTSVAYYKRNMYVLNLVIHDVVSGQGYMYVWDETIASRGSQEVESCIVKHVKTHASDVRRVILYSDCCTGQNRNMKLALTLLKLVCSADITATCIDHKFYIPGHSYMPSDSDFGTIEIAAKKCKELLIPEHWYNLIKTAKRSKPFNVTVMKPADFVSTQPLEKEVSNRKMDEDKRQVHWLNIHWIRVERNKPNTISIKTTTNEWMPFSELNIAKSCKGRPKKLNLIHQPQLYSNDRSISKIKKKDMLDLLPYLPPIYHSYFVKLQTIDETNDE